MEAKDPREVVVKRLKRLRVEFAASLACGKPGPEGGTRVGYERCKAHFRPLFRSLAARIKELENGGD